jgi:hypothetical protein
LPQAVTVWDKLDLHAVFRRIETLLVWFRGHRV